ncbi:MAG: hypothetical protein GY862_33355 [Gammaproteobacteria bacterium]|nr:hypothetical protein [Gammaproteobacteria bacterium]
MPYLDPEILVKFAKKYLWWKTPDEVIETPARVIAQVMDIGDYDDVQIVAKQAGDEYLKTLLNHAEIGQFNERSWAYWHYRLGLALPGQVPPMPQRKVA